METVRNLNTLKAMLKAGLITFSSQTGLKITGLYSNKYFICYYVDDYGPQGPNFIYKDCVYSLKYFSGCFYPYVVKISDNAKD